MKKKILIVDDEESVRWVIGKCLEKADYKVDYGVSGSHALERVSSEYFSLIILDITMPDISGLEVLHEIRTRGIETPVIIITAQNTVKNAIDAMKEGAFDYIAKPFDLDEVRLTVDRAIISYENARKVGSLAAKLNDSCETHQGIVGNSPLMLKIYKTIGRIAGKDITVLIQGESGTGKELIARAIHMNSPRNEEKLVSVNLAALPKDLIESELFGYEKGAFTGALVRKLGRFDEASGGTLHLDEIGDMPLELQTKLLRVLEEKKFYRLGSEKPVEVDVRVILSTNKRLDDEVEKGTFRSDLYYRINAITIFVPALRKRKEDILVLVDYFNEKYSIELGSSKKAFSDGARKIMLEYSWPGNVRELENTVKRVVVLASENLITSEVLLDAAPYLSGKKKAKDELFGEYIKSKLEDLLSHNRGDASGAIYDLVIQKIEKPLIEEVLRIAKGNKKKAAAILGINRNTLSKKIENHGIKADESPD